MTQASSLQQGPWRAGTGGRRAGPRRDRLCNPSTRLGGILALLLLALVPQAIPAADYAQKTAPEPVPVPDRVDRETLRSAAAIQALVQSAQGAGGGGLNLTSAPDKDAWQCTGNGRVRTACNLACRISQDFGGCACSTIPGGCECDCD